MRVRLLMTVILAGSALWLGSAAAFAAPATTPMTVYTNGFEATDGPFEMVTSPVSVASWGPITNVKRSGTRSLWIAGTQPTKFPVYPVDTNGSAYVRLYNLSQYYSATISHWYISPSRGAADENSFKFQYQNVPYTFSKTVVIPDATAWTQKSYNLASLTNGQLSRTRVDVQFRFFDSSEGGGITVGNGQGPAIDDFAVTGWKYGPPRQAAVGQVGTNMKITWARPDRAVGSSTPEERTISYRVWRSPKDANSWTEVSPAGRLGNSALSHLDPITQEGVAFEYMVQAWDPGTGTGYGQAVKTGSISAPAANPSLTMTLPPYGFSLAGPVKIEGMASDSGAGVKAVDIAIRRADGRYWNGWAWTTTSTWLAVDTHTSNWSTWSKTWTPDSEVRSSGEVVSVTSRATDWSGRTSTQTSLSAGTLTGSALTASRSASVVSYGAASRLSGALTSWGAPLAGKPVRLEYYSAGWKVKETKYTDYSGKVYFDARPRNKTSYRLAFVGSGYLASYTGPMTVTPKVALSRPTRPKSARKKVTFYVKGTIKPVHPSRRTYSKSSAVKVRAYRYSNGKWVYKRTFYTKISKVSSTTSKYVAAVKLPYTGKWRLKAYAPTDSKHYATWSSMTTTFRVR